MKKLLAGAIIFFLLLPGLILAQETAVYDEDYTAPRCRLGTSPCLVPESLINGRDNMVGGNEPNEPNTISTSPCPDGTSGDYHGDESLDSFSVIDLSGPKFSPGDTIKVEAVVYCFNTTDRLTVFSAPDAGNPSWTHMGDTPCTLSGSTETLEITFNLPAGDGNQVIRAAFTYGPSSTACVAGSYNDRDDVIISVNDSDYDGMGDSWEDSNSCVDRNSRDSWLDPDNDGLTSMEEMDLGTDPCDPDTDGDGMDDLWEANNVTDPLTKDASDDSDYDGLDNLGEYLSGCDPSLSDSDGGGVLDDEEAARGMDCQSALDDYEELEETVGINGAYYSGSPRIYGNFYEVSRETVLTGFEQYLYFSVSDDYRVLVYEGNTAGHSFEKIYEKTHTMDETGQQWFPSGDMYVIFRPGKTYFVGIGYDTAGTGRAYCRYGDTTTVSVNFGEVNYGGYIGNNWPPPQSYSIIDVDQTRYYQRINTCTMGCFPRNVALIRDSESWSNANTSVMSDFGIPYTVVGSTQISSTDYSLFDKIVIESRQDNILYEALENDSERINEWVANGGDLAFHGADNPPLWYGNYTVPPGMEGAYSSRDNLTVDSPEHWSVVGVTSSGIDDWSSSAHGEVTATATTPVDVISADSTGNPVLSVFPYGQGEVAFSTMTIEHGANPLGSREEAKALHRNLVLHEEKPLVDCGAAGSTTIADTAGGASGVDRYRGAKYSIDTSALLIEFKQKLNPQDGATIHYAVMESDTESGTYTKVWERLRYAGDTTPGGYYSSGPVNIRLRSGKYYVMIAGWNSSTYYYYGGSAGFPFDTSFGQALGGAYYSPYSIGDTATFSTSSTGYSQEIVTQPYDRCRLADSDGDGLSDSYESAFAGTDEFLADSDGDGMPDTWELAFLLDPLTGDSANDADGDGLRNLKEYAFGANPFLPDADRDGMPDGWEVDNNLCMDLYQGDSSGDPDGDLMSSLEEYNAGTNPCVLTDTDGDGMPDGWELANGLDPNDDRDGLLDPDGDGLNNWLEYYYGTDPATADSDNDGMSDYDEVFLVLTNPNDPDTDGDGMEDGWEYEYGCDPFFLDHDADPDGDGMSNLDEFNTMTDPFFPNNDNDRDALFNEVEDDTGVYVDYSQTGTSPIYPDTDGGGELDGLEVYLGREPNNTPGDDLGWEPVGWVLPNANYDNINPSMAVTDSGTVIMVYEYPGFTNRICRRTWTGSSWSGATYHFGDKAEMPILRKAPDGVVHLFWKEYDSGTSERTLHHAYWDGSTFTGAETCFGETATSFTTYDVAIDEDGHFHAAYEYRDGDYYIRHRSNESGSWSEPYDAGGPGFSHRDINIVAVENEVHIVWSYQYYDSVEWSNRDFSGWSKNNVIGRGLKPSMTFDDRGRVFVSWQNKGDDEIEGIVYEDGSWSNIFNISENAPVSTNVGLARDFYGNINAFWNDAQGELNTIMSSMYHEGQWLAPVKVGETNPNSEPPANFTSVSKKDGELFVSWQEINPSDPEEDRDISYSRLVYPDEDSDDLNSRLEFIIGTKYNDSDTDDDGLTDGQEMRTYNSNPLYYDTDGDGLDDSSEVALGAEPTTPYTDSAEEQDGIEAYAGRDPTASGDDVNWTTPHMIAGEDMLLRYKPSYAIDENDIHHLCYYTMDDIIYHEKDGGTWGPPEVVDSLTGGVQYMDTDIAVGPGSTVHLVYTDRTSDYTNVLYAGKSGGTWQTPVNVTASTVDQNNAPAIAVDKNGVVHLAYHKSEGYGGDSELIYRYNDGSGWSSETNLSQTPGTGSGYASLDVGSDGRMHLTWVDNYYGNYEIFYRYRDDGPWSDTIRVTNSIVDEGGVEVTGGFAGRAFISYNGPRFISGVGEDWSLPMDPFSKMNIDFTISPHKNVYFSGGTFFITGTAVEEAGESLEDAYIAAFNGERWFAPFKIEHLADYRTIALPVLSVDRTGNLHLVFVNQYTDIGGIMDMYYTALQYPDTDGDGMNLLQEFYLGTDSSLADTDGDGINDKEENYFLTDPNLYDTDGDGIDDYYEINFSLTDPNLYDTDGDGMPDLWEIQWGTDVLVADSTEDPDNDGISNLDEFKYHTDPTITETVPSSSCSSPQYTASSPISVTFDCDSYLATVELYMSYNNSSFINMSSYGYSRSCMEPDNTFEFEPSFGEGLYRFYTIARLGVSLIEAPPAFPDTSTIYDTQGPAMVSVTDEGEYTSDNNQLIAFAEAEDPGDFPSGIDKYYYAVGTAAYDSSGWDDVLSWTESAGGSSVSHVFGSTVLSEGVFGSTVLSEGTAYYVTVKVADNAGNESPLPFSTDGIVVDGSPPSAPSVTDDGDYSTSTEMLHATWSGASDAVSGIDHYYYCISTSTTGAPDVADWTMTGDTETTRWGLSLSEGSTYYIGVKAINGAGLESAIGWSDGIMVDSQSPEILSSTPSHREIVFGELFDNVVWLSGLTVDITLSDPASGVNGSSVAVVLDFDTVCAGDCPISGDTLSFVYDSDTLGRGNHVINVTAADHAGNYLFQNIIFVVEDPRKVIINPVWSEWSPGDGALTFTAAGGTGEYYWVSTAGSLDSTTASEVGLSPTASPGAYIVSVSDAKLVSAQATVVINGLVDLAPAVTRLNPGDTVRFTASGGPTPYNWTATGGSCDISGDTKSCLFTAGAIEGEYSVTAEEDGGASFTSRVIISASVGRAIVVVGGGLVDDNRQVDTLNAMGHFAYETLLSRGFGKDQIQYLNPDATQLYDGDGDGYSDDIDGAPTGASLQDAIETWATTDGGPGNPAVGPGVPLIIYLIDHGSSSYFLINYDEGGNPDVVSPADLDTWITSVESGASVDTVVVYDACYSGAFLSTLGTGGPNRMIVTSSSSSQSSYFGVNGTVSFSQFFWQNIRQSKTVFESFNSAKSALASWSGQTPWLDDNGTGVYETGGSADGAWASDFEIGADFSTGALLPELSACVDSVALDSSTCYTSYLLDSDTSAVLFAEVDNVQPDEVGAVFAIISPPGYSPPEGADGSYETPWLTDGSGNPLPRAYLTWDAGEGHFSHVFTPSEMDLIFDVNGRYTATLFSLDKSGQASASYNVNLTIFGPDSYEPDADWTSGSTVSVNSTNAQAHNFHQEFDEDWITFTVSGATAKYYKIYTENLAENCDTVLELYGESLGSLTPLIISDDDSGSDYGASMLYKLLEPGTYHLLCRHYDGTVFGEFTEYDLRVDTEDLTTGTLEGYVTDAATGYGLYGAHVTLLLSGDNEISTATGTGGHYIFHNEVPAGSGYTLEVTKANYLTGTTGCPDISIGGISRRDVALEPKSDTGVLAGFVYDGSTVLPGVAMYISDKSTTSDNNGFYSMRLSPGSYSIWALRDGFDTYFTSGLSVSSGDTTLFDVYMSAVDTDQDSLSDNDEQEDGSCTLYDNADSDGDGLCDGNTTVYDGGTVCVAGEDLNLNGVVDAGESDPCDADSDGDLTDDLDDCDPVDENNWSSCATCVDSDGDGWYTGCDAYTTIDGPDCDDADDNNWSSCGSCVDSDGDSWYTGCDAYTSIDGPDCDDADDNNWSSCGSCVDSDGDSWYTGCDAYASIDGPDCDDTDVDNWSSCGSCNDSDGDTWYEGCDAYSTRNGPDCNDSDVDNWSSCATCQNTDSDSWYAGCDSYTIRNGPDCDDADGNAWDTCGTCVDDDSDTYYELCNQYVGINGPDCDDADENNWDSCGSCSDDDSDSWYTGCDAYASIDGPDCDDADENAWDTCATCTDDDSDTYYELCNQYVGINGPDCDDADENNWDSCVSCIDDDTDGWYVACDAYVSIDGPDCDDSDIDNWTSCATCLDSDGDGWYAGCDAYTLIDGPDCEDGDSSVYPGAPELCDGVDNQCPGDAGHGEVDEGCDTDGDGLNDSVEDGYCTDSSLADTDGDGLCDGDTAVVGVCSAGEDWNVNGVVDEGETDPCDPDSDDDGLTDGLEGNTLGTDPLHWDSDDDGLPDKFEYDNMSGHTVNLDPLVADGNTDFDSDLNPNVHEYWNGTDLWVADPMNHHGFGQFGCAYWGEGNGNCVIDSGDLTNLKNNLMANPSDYSGVIPDNSDTQELNGNGVFDSGDLSYLKGFLILSLNTNVPSRADELVVLSQPSGPVQVGDTCHVTLGVLSGDTSDSQYTAGFAVVFETSGNGSATVWGGDGEDSANRYDYSGAVSENAPARVTLKIESAGTVYVDAYIPQCQGGPGPYEGRYSPRIDLASPVIIEAQ